MDLRGLDNLSRTSRVILVIASYYVGIPSNGAGAERDDLAVPPQSKPNTNEQKHHER